MKLTLPLTGLALGAVLLTGCQDHTSEIEKLERDQVAQQRRFDAAEQEWSKERADLRAEIDALQDQLGTIGADGEEARPITDQVKDLEAAIAELKSSPGVDEELLAKVESLEAQLGTVKEEAVEAAKVEAAKTSAGGVDEEAIADMMAKKLAEEQAANAPTKDLNAALDRLDISQGEKDMIRQHIIDSKQATLETLEIPTADGRIFAEELIDKFIEIQNGDAKMTDVHKLYLELSAEKIPGDIEGRTYGEAIEDIKARNREDISRILSEDDQKKLSAAHEDWSDFEVGDGDPFGELYMERLQKYQKENGTDE